MEDTPAALPGQLRGTLMSQGAEARIFRTEFAGRSAVVKERFAKGYRHPVLDARLTLRRLNKEARSLLKARRLGVLTPAIYAVDSDASSIVFEFIRGVSVKDFLLTLPAADSASSDDVKEVSGLIASTLATLHDGGLVHGDLTTSNMLLRQSEDGKRDLVLIDFGLSFNSTLAEDKAVDLYVLERALLSLHSAHEGLMEAVLTSYSRSSRYWSATLNKLAQGQPPQIIWDVKGAN